jgi:hypothetical protein
MTPFVKLLTRVLGVVLLLIGVAGFFTGDMLLWFEVDATHNIVHILSGVVALAAAGTYSYSRMFLIVFGLVYGAVAVVGFAMGGDIFGLFHANMADNYLHTGIAAACLLVGFGSKSRV